MSRIDEALRRATQTAPVSSDSSTAASALAGMSIEIDPSTLDAYVVEEPRKPRESVAAFPKPAASRLQVQAAPRPIIVPEAFQSRLVVGRTISSATVEQYRRLAAILHELHEKEGLKRLMVTSAVPAEGKTLTIANVALTLSESFRQRVLLVDADLRRPSLHDLFGVPNGTGVSDVVAGSGHSISPLQISSCLSLLTAGQRLSSPLVMLTSERLRDIIVDASEHFDWVLLDTPPVGLLPDAQLAARMSDAALFVIAAGSTPYRLVQRAIADLNPERIVGTVLNRVDKRMLETSGSYGSYYDGAALHEAGTR